MYNRGEIMNNRLVIVDAGHGGIDSGAVGNGLLEKDLTLQASKYMYQRLQELGIPTKITREEDIDLPKGERIKKVLSLNNNLPNTILVSNHINAGGAEGAEIVYALRNNSSLADLALKYIAENGQIPRKTYQRRLPENPSKDYYYILRETGNTEPILVEYGFIDNAKDANKLKNNLNDYVEGVVKAIAEYLNYPYNPPGGENQYIVKKGDTLYSISKRFNISIDELIRLNNLSNNNLRIGQVLIVKEEYPVAKNYIVKKGDTLYSIARDNNTSVNSLIEANQLTTDQLKVGEQLIIPDSSEEIDIVSDEYDLYTVEKGDSLWSISKKYGITFQELIDLNNLSNLTLQIGQQLLVPKTNKNYYMVQSGDTLWSVAKRNNLTVQELKDLNNLTSNLLTIGQQLLIK